MKYCILVRFPETLYTIVFSEQTRKVLAAKIIEINKYRIYGKHLCLLGSRKIFWVEKRGNIQEMELHPFRFVQDSMFPDSSH